MADAGPGRPGLRDRQDRHAPLASHPVAEEAIEAWLAAVAAVDPTALVRTAVRQGHLDDWLFAGGRARTDPRSLRVLAIGKAAARMVWGLVEGGIHFTGIGVAPSGHKVPLVDTFRWVQGDHPVPAEHSFAAGAAVREYVAGLPADAPLLVLLSGGASSVLEVALDDTPEGRARLAAQHAAWLREPLPVGELNRRRASLSALKAGGLGRLALTRTRAVRAWVLADTPSEEPETVGSGPFAAPGIGHRVLAGNAEAVQAAGLRLGLAGYTVYRHPHRLAGLVEEEAARLAAAFAALPGQVALVAGGEPLVALPPGAPPGGRAQHGALALALALQAAPPGTSPSGSAVVLAAATDGMDGAGASGAWLAVQDLAGRLPEAQEALARHAASPFLAGLGRLLPADATGTNVNDVWILLRPS